MLVYSSVTTIFFDNKEQVKAYAEGLKAAGGMSPGAAISLGLSDSAVEHRTIDNRPAVTTHALVEMPQITTK